MQVATCPRARVGGRSRCGLRRTHRMTALDEILRAWGTVRSVRSAKTTWLTPLLGRSLLPTGARSGVEAARSVLEFEDFLFGRNRTALERVAEGLLDLQAGSCFHSRSRIGRSRENESVTAARIAKRSCCSSDDRARPWAARVRGAGGPVWVVRSGGPSAGGSTPRLVALAASTPVGGRPTATASSAPRNPSSPAARTDARRGRRPPPAGSVRAAVRPSATPRRLRRPGLRRCCSRCTFSRTRSERPRS